MLLELMDELRVAASIGLASASTKVRAIAKPSDLRGRWELPRYDVRGTLRDFFIADEGVGQVVGQITINGDLLTTRLTEATQEAAV